MTLDQLAALVIHVGGTLTLEPLSKTAVRISAHRPGVTPLSVSTSAPWPLSDRPRFLLDFAEQLEIQHFFATP